MGAECCTNQSARKEQSMSILAALGKDGAKTVQLQNKRSRSRQVAEGSPNRRVARRNSPVQMVRDFKVDSRSEPLSQAHCRLHYAPLVNARSDQPQVYHVHEVLEFNPKAADLKALGRVGAKNGGPEADTAARGPESSACEPPDRSEMEERPYRAYLMLPKRRQEQY